MSKQFIERIMSLEKSSSSKFNYFWGNLSFKCWRMKARTEERLGVMLDQVTVPIEKNEGLYIK